MPGNIDLEQEVAAVGDLSRAELVARWIKAYGSPPPKGIHQGLLERSAAWHLQASHLGGLSAAARAVLRAANKPRAAKRTQSTTADNLHLPRDDVDRDTSVEADRRAAASSAHPPLPPGTRLMREWNGRMYVVDITEQGALLDGKLYRSLTAAAKRITGTHWSGPRFFGL